MSLVDKYLIIHQDVCNGNGNYSKYEMEIASMTYKISEGAFDYVCGTPTKENLEKILEKCIANNKVPIIRKDHSKSIDGDIIMPTVDGGYHIGMGKFKER